MSSRRVVLVAKVWFITEASRDLGRIWAETALERGDSVAVTARGVEPLAELADRFGERVFVRALDVRDRKDVFAAVAEVRERFGRIDIAVGTRATATPERSKSSTSTRPRRTSTPTSAARPGSCRQRCRSCGSRATDTSLG